MKKKKLLICGATGFIGRNLAEYFSEIGEYEVFGTYFKSEPYNNEKIKMLYADLRNNEAVRKTINGKDIVIQAAATTSGSKDIVTRPYIHVTDNAVMNSLILREVFDQGIKHFIFPSCTIMYQPSEIPLKEEDFNANDEIIGNYFGAGWTKVYTEKMCEFFSRLGRTKHTVIRHSNVYGPYDKFDLEHSHVFGATMTKVLNSKDGKITVWGTGEEKRDLLYVGDLVNFIELSINNQQDKFKLYNLGCGKAISVRGLVEKIIDISNKDIRVEYDTSKPTIKSNILIDSSKVKEELSWKPITSLEEGIKKTMDWYNKNINS